MRRDDVAAVFGDRYRFAGYELPFNTAELSLGQHTLYVYARSTVTGEWQLMTRTFNVANTPPQVPALVTPTSGATVSGPVVQFSWQDAPDPDNRPRAYRDYSIEVRDQGGAIIAQMPWTATTTWSASFADGTYRNLGAKAHTVHGWDEAPQRIAMRKRGWYTEGVEHMSAFAANENAGLQATPLARASRAV